MRPTSGFYPSESEVKIKRKSPLSFSLKLPLQLMGSSPPPLLGSLLRV